MRSEVWSHVINIPMRVLVQRDGGEVVIQLPPYALPMDNTVTAKDIDSALKKMQDKMHEYWGGQPTAEKG